MAKKSKKKESEPKNEVITNCDNQQFGRTWIFPWPPQTSHSNT